MPRARRNRGALGSKIPSQGNVSRSASTNESAPVFSASLPETAEACANEIELLEEQQRKIMDRMKMVTVQLNNVLRKQSKSSMINKPTQAVNAGDEDESVENKSNKTNMEKQAKVFTSNRGNEEVDNEQLMDARVEVYDIDMAEDEDNPAELSSPLISAIKKLHQRSDQKRDLKMWSQNLANLFLHTDVDGSGYIDEKEYQQMLDRLDISDELKFSLREKFDSIDKDGNDGICLTEFLFFFLTFPMFRKELQNNAHSNSPFIYEKALTSKQQWRQWLYCVVEHPEYNNASKILFCTDLMLTSVPILILCAEGAQSSLNIDCSRHTGMWYFMWSISIFFAAKYFFGLMMCKYKKKFIFDVIHTFELVSFLFWIYYNTLGHTDSLDPMGFVVFRVVRFIDLHKVFKLAALEEDIGIYVNVLKLAYTSSGAVLMLLVFTIFLFSLLMYVFERGLYEDDRWERDADEGMSPFADMSSCIYFVLVTMTTLGYGDMYPITYVGRMVAMITVFVGLCNITFLINIVGDCFEEVFREYVLKKSKQMQEEQNMYLTDCVQGVQAGSRSWLNIGRKSKRLRHIKVLAKAKANEKELY